jgi:hypothetical protein
MNRNDPEGKRALFESTATSVPTDETPLGRRALFSTASGRPGSVVVECSSCGEHKRIQAGEAIARILRLSVWVPLVRYNRWMRCPSCEQRSWCRVGWLD